MYRRKQNCNHVSVISIRVLQALLLYLQAVILRHFSAQNTPSCQVPTVEKEKISGHHLKSSV